MPVQPGSSLGHYTVSEQLGSGGMGEVYRAEDTKLDRDVAIKVLPETLARNGDLLARFELEAKALAALNHQNIATIHGFERQDGQWFLVMELVVGENLAERLESGAVPVEQALQLAGQIAEGLEFAHDKGVVHRDLKPANLMVTPEDRVKILDFGLVKTVGGDSSSAESVAETLTAGLTRDGVILGTAPYMSPEQARGEPVDKRSDIWSFGVVFFEMLTGRRLFGGATGTDVLADVLRAEVDFGRLPSDTPASIRRLLGRCLDRNEKNRLRDIGEARVEIAECLANPNEPGPDAAAAAALTPTVETNRLGGRRLPWLLAILGLGLSAVLGFLQFLQPASSASEVAGRVVRSKIQLPDGVRLAGWSSPAVAFSPDETTLAFVGERDGRQSLYLRRLDEAEAAEVDGSEGAEGPFFSPDGQWVAFAAGSVSGRGTEPPMLKRAPVDGGPTQRVVPLFDYVGGSWGNDGYIYYSDRFAKGGLKRVREAGGEEEPVFTGRRGEAVAELGVGWPQHIDDGRRLLLTSFGGQVEEAALQDTSSQNTAVVVDLATGEVTDLEQPADFSRYASGGHLVVSGTDAVLRAAPFDLRTLETTRLPTDLVEGVAITGNYVPVFALGGGGSAVFATGYARGSDRVLSRLARIDPRDGQVEHLAFEPASFGRAMSLAVDGKRLAVATWDASLWIYDLERLTRQKLSSEGIEGLLPDFPRWSPDGKSLAFSLSDRRNGVSAHVWSADGAIRRVMEDELGVGTGDPLVAAWGADGDKVMIEQDGRGLGLLDGVSSPVWLDVMPDASRADISPDGHWIAYRSRASGQSDVRRARCQLSRRPA
ncbi:MAG: protein kinase [Acidobacteriota bacterium]